MDKCDFQDSWFVEFILTHTKDLLSVADFVHHAGLCAFIFSCGVLVMLLPVLICFI